MKTSMFLYTSNLLPIEVRTKRKGLVTLWSWWAVTGYMFMALFSIVLRKMTWNSQHFLARGFTCSVISRPDFNKMIFVSENYTLYSNIFYLVCHWCFNDTTAKLGVIWRREKLERMELMWRGYIWPPQHVLWCCSPAWWLSWQPNTPWEASIFDIKTTCLNQRKLMWLQLNMLELIHLH